MDDNGGGDDAAAAPDLPFPLARTWGPGARQPCQHVLLAEFDIDRGCTMRHQYPSPIDGGQAAADALAETMLPEGAHARREDSLWFFLNRGARTWDEQEQEAAVPIATPTTPAATTTEAAPSYFLYGFTLVRTLHDAALRRGAKVMALAVLSPYPFIQPLAESAMARALEECLAVTVVDGGDGETHAGVLRRVYECINAFDVASLPRPTLVERALMRRCVAAHSVNDLGGLGELAPGRAYTPQAWVHRAQLAWQPRAAGAKRPRSPPSPFPSPTPQAAPAMEMEPLPITIPLYLGSDEGPGPRSVALLLQTFGPAAVTRVLPALLAGRRVLFVGHGHAAADVGRFVLTAAGLVSPPLRGVLRRVFPYATLSDLRFLETPGGYVAGTTNPVFARREEWWDLLCVLDLSKGKGRCYAPGERDADESGGNGGGQKQGHAQQRAPSPTGPFSLIAPLSPTRAATTGGTGGGGGDGGGGEGEAEADAAMYARLRALAAGGGDVGEEGLRAAVRLHVQALLELAWDGTSPVHNGRAREGSRRFARANAQRVRALKRLPEFAAASPDPWQGLQPPLPVPGTTLRSHLRLLATHALLADVELERIYLDLSNALHTPASLLVLLTWLPEGGGEDGDGGGRGGLLRLATALFHENQQIRFHAALLLERLRGFSATRPALAALNPMLLHAHQRVLEEMKG